MDDELQCGSSNIRDRISRPLPRFRPVIYSPMFAHREQTAFSTGPCGEIQVRRDCASSRIAYTGHRAQQLGQPYFGSPARVVAGSSDGDCSCLDSCSDASSTGVGGLVVQHRRSCSWNQSERDPSPQTCAITRPSPTQYRPESVRFAHGPVAQRLVQGTHRKVHTRSNSCGEREEFREPFQQG